MRTAFCLVILALATATAPIASAQTTAASKPLEACSLLTKEDAAAALGEAATGPKATNIPGTGPSACEFKGSGIHTITLNVFSLQPGQAAVYAAMCAKKTREGLTGLGDTTCWYNEKHGELQVLKGNTFFSIELRRSGDPTEPIKAVARKVYERVK